MSADPVLARLDADLPQALERLMTFLAIPSISTDPAYAADCDRAADWLVADLKALGATAEKRATPGHPMVVGHIGEGAPHLLFYGHYDVQPADPPELWHRDPFDPAVEDTPAGRVIRGRGAADDKGQLMTFVEACRAWIAEHGALPCRITFFFEGEEESGSPSLVPFLRENADELAADLALVCDTGMYDRKTPSIVTQLRGMLREEVVLRGASRDLHSGLYGGLAVNPIHVLSRVLADLHDDTGRVTLEGFYDGVAETPPEVRAQWDALAFDAEGFLGRVGLSHGAGERDRTALERLWARPTAEVNGIEGGYTGAGFKTVLPAEARAKVSFRLVGEQDPEAIHRAFVDHVERRLPPDVTAEFPMGDGAPATQMDVSRPAFEAARAALSAEWETEAVFAGVGGSIPVAGYFQSVLGTEPMLIGFGRDDDALHSPNEKYDLESFHKGARSWVRILEALTRG
ncbi:M20/M25/M40 family metallo-hydrolase [Rhodosalinus sediminis]|uniref:M20/M25/M40 family metallo-hydrolase n=1 Tax=Rhodosalinus sediminis TaxID=1940533 RepID=A0A3D9BU98_9RHOB|nr:M20/M25/M40 family metallo-hydrolase [Rhodosalinus sediminis]REC57068.1 M20/M25/M40 family metallo-hydrolase [Rhodosalinus sediminis]